MKKLLLMLLAAGLFSFGTISCDAGRENATEENVEGDKEGGEEVEDAAEDVGEEVEEGAEEVEEGVREE